MSWNAALSGHTEDQAVEAEVLKILADAARKIDALAGSELYGNSASTQYHGNCGSLKDHGGASTQDEPAVPPVPGPGLGGGGSTGGGGGTGGGTGGEGGGG